MASEHYSISCITAKITSVTYFCFSIFSWPHLSGVLFILFFVVEIGFATTSSPRALQKTTSAYVTSFSILCCADDCNRSIELFGVDNFRPNHLPNHKIFLSYSIKKESMANLTSEKVYAGGSSCSQG